MDGELNSLYYHLGKLDIVNLKRSYMLSDTATSISRAGVRPSPNQTFGYVKTLNNSLHEGKVVKVGPAHAFESTLVVYIFGTRETVKVNAATYPNASQNGLGTYTPYLLGDHVLISFLGGDVNKPTIIGRVNKTNGLSSEVIEGPEPLVEGDIVGPQPFTLSPGGQVVNPSPCSCFKESVKWSGLAQVSVAGMLK